MRALSWPAGTKVSSLGRRDLGTGDTAAAAAAAAIRRTRPHLVLNAAAYTAVDRAEAEPALAHALNAELPLAAAQACAELGIPLVHVSTDYVFDGEKATAYLETDPANPLSIYGASKLAGEINIESVAAADGWRRPTRLRWAILRSSWVFSGTGDSFPAKLLARARAGETLRVVDDQTGCPTTASALAQAMQAVGRRLLEAVVADPTLEITVDVDRRTVSVPALGIEEPFPLDDSTRERFLQGLDDIGITLRSAAAIDDYETHRPGYLPHA